VSSAVPGSRERELSAFIDAYVAESRPVELRCNEESWLRETTGQPEHAEEAGRLEAQLKKMLARPEAFATLTRLRAGGPLADPLLERQLTLLHHAHRGSQLAPEMIDQQVELSNRLGMRFIQYRATLDGATVSDNALADVLRTSDDSAHRRRAWEASKQIGAEVEHDLLALVRLRNEGARSLGFDNYYSMALELDEIDETELFALFDELERETDGLWRTYKSALDARLAKRFGVAVDELRPWHYSDPFFQEAPAAEVSLDPAYESHDVVELTRHYFAAVGFDISGMLEKADLYERAGKCQHAFCMTMDRADDVRVLCNVKNNERWMGTMLHEYGHAVYDQQVDRTLPWILRGHAHILSTEASAMLFGRLAKNPVWLREWAQADPAFLRTHESAIARALPEQLLVQARWMMLMAHMERAVYRDPGQDLRTLWWDLAERFQWVRRPEGRFAPDWAAKIHFSIAPAYYHNYQLGEMLASQLQDHLLQNVLGGGADAWARYVRSPEVAGFLIPNYYRPGRTYDWRELTRRATGRPLGAAAFVKDLAVATTSA